MKILIITAFPPNQKTAGQDYTRRMILDLLKKGHDMAIIYAEYPGHKMELPDKVTVLGTIHPSFLNCLKLAYYHPFFTRRFDWNTLAIIREAASEYDMLYFDFSQVHVYSLYVKHNNKVLMCHDVISQKFGRNSKFQVPFIKLIERRTLKTADQVVCFSKKDRILLNDIYGIKSIAVNFYLKNGKYHYDNTSSITNHFCFYGAWNRRENSEALEFFLDNVYSKLPNNFKFDVIGGGLNGKLETRLKEYDNFIVKGFVDDPVKCISECQALIAPLHFGAGVKVKVIDSLSSGTPVIGTGVAFEGIDDNLENKLFYHAETADEFVSTISEWTAWNLEEKQAAADEFFTRYNTNHFPDYLKQA